MPLRKGVGCCWSCLRQGDQGGNFSSSFLNILGLATLESSSGLIFFATSESSSGIFFTIHGDPNPQHFSQRVFWAMAIWCLQHLVLQWWRNAGRRSAALLAFGEQCWGSKSYLDPVSGSKTVKGLLYLFVLSVCSLLESLLGRSRLRVRSLSVMLELTSLKVWGRSVPHVTGDLHKGVREYENTNESI